MTVPSANSRMDYHCDGATVIFPYDFYIFEDADLRVSIVLVSTGVETVLTLDALSAGYSVAGAGTVTGGTITLTDTYSALYDLIILRDVAITQDTDWIENGDLDAETLEASVDRLTMICQQLQEQLDREITLNLPTLLMGYLYNDGTSMSWTSLTTTAYAGDIDRGADAAKAAVPGAGDIYIATDTYKLYVCFVAGTWKCLPSITDMTAKVSLVDNDVLLLEDSAALYVKKKITRANLKTDITDACVKLTGNQTVNGIKTLGSFAITPSSAPTTDYMVANKKYVDDMNSSKVGYNAGSNADVDNSGYKTLATVTMTTTAGRNVLINGSFKITPHATVNITTIYLELYRDATQVVALTSTSSGLDSVAFQSPFVPLNWIDEAAGTASTTYTLKVKTDSGSAITIAGYLSVAEIK